MATTTMSKTPAIGKPDVERMFNTLSDPVREASLFYATYYLTEVENVTEASFDFAERSNGLYDALYVYGLYTVVREMSHATNHYRIDGEKLVSVPMERQHAHVSQAYPASMGELVNEILRQSAVFRGQIQDFPTVLNVSDILERAERHFAATTEPEAFLKAAEAVFNTREYDGDTRYAHLTGWEDEFGGPAWAGICRHLQRRGDLTKTVWLNQSWSVQHNNAVWMDKILTSQNCKETVGPLWERLTGGTAAVNDTDIYRRVLPRLLDERKEGEMGPVFLFAEAYNVEVGVNLRRWRVALGIPLPTPAMTFDVSITLEPEQYIDAFEAVRVLRRWNARASLAQQLQGVDLFTTERDFEMLEPLLQRLAEEENGQPREPVTVTMPVAEAQAWLHILQDMALMTRGLGGHPSIPEAILTPLKNSGATNLSGAEGAISRQINEAKDRAAVTSGGR